MSSGGAPPLPPAMAASPTRLPPRCPAAASSATPPPGHHPRVASGDQSLIPVTTPSDTTSSPDIPKMDNIVLIPVESSPRDPSSSFNASTNSLFARSGGGGTRRRSAAIRASSRSEFEKEPLLGKANCTESFSTTSNGTWTGFASNIQGWRKSNEDAHVVCIRGASGRIDETRAPHIATSSSGPHRSPSPGGVSTAASPDMSPSLTPFVSGHPSPERHVASPSFESVLAGTPVIGVAVVFDGHNGRGAAEAAATHLVPMIVERLSAVLSPSTDPPTDGACAATARPSMPQGPPPLEDVAAAAAAEDGNQPSSKYQPQTPLRETDAHNATHPPPTVATPPAPPRCLAAATISDAEREAIEEAFHACDDELRGMDTVADSGCTVGCAVLLEDNRVFLCSAGDCRLGVATADGQLLMVVDDDHNPGKNPSEARRLEEIGASVVNGRIDGRLGVSRALGDFGFKPKSKPRHLQSVSATPEIKACQMDAGRFIFVGCDGVWEMNELANVATCLSQHQYAADAVSKVVLGSCATVRPLVPGGTMALLPGSDNVSLVVLQRDVEEDCLSDNPSLTGTSVASPQGNPR